MSKGDLKRLGDYIREVDVRNKDGKVNNLVGLTIAKAFIPSVANTIGTDLTKYKIIKQNQFACSLMQVSRDGKMPIAIYKGEDAIMSPAYPVFEVSNNALLPDYLQMWFARSEFDREATFYAVGGVRGSLTWEDFMDMKIPVPSIEEQRKIVERHQAIQQRIEVNRKIIAKLEEAAQAIYRKMFVDDIDPENLPDGWRMGTLSEITSYQNNKIDTSLLKVEEYVSTENMLKDKKGIVPSSTVPEGRCSSFNINDILISNIRPYFKKIWKATFDGGCSADVLCLRATKFSSEFLYYTLERDNFFDYVTAGSNGVKMPRGDKNWIMNYSILIPDEKAESIFNTKVSPIKKLVNELNEEIKLLETFYKFI